MSSPHMSGRDDDPIDERPGRDAGDLLNDDGSINVSEVTSISNAERHGGYAITADRCQRFRERAAREGDLPDDIAADAEICPQTVRWHLRGECPHTGALPALERGWYMPPSETTRDCEPGASARVDAATCGEIRQRLLDGGNCRSVADALESVSRRTVEKHGRGDCSHSHGDPAPLAFGWHVPGGDA